MNHALICNAPNKKEIISCLAVPPDLLEFLILHVKKITPPPAF